MNELNSCPFCGEEKIERQLDNDGYRHVCTACGAKGPETYVDIKSAKLWNERTSSAGSAVVLSDEKREQLEDAIQETEYKYFGDYEMSADQRTAVEVLVEAAREQLSAAAAQQPVAYVDPKALENFEAERAHVRGGQYGREWMWASPAKGLVPLYTAAQASAQAPVAEYDGVEFGRYTIRWTNGPMPIGTKFYTATKEQTSQASLSSAKTQSVSYDPIFNELLGAVVISGSKPGQALIYERDKYALIAYIDNKIAMASEASYAASPVSAQTAAVQADQDQSKWKAAYEEKQRQFTAETLRTSQQAQLLSRIRQWLKDRYHCPDEPWAKSGTCCEFVREIAAMSSEGGASHA